LKYTKGNWQVVIGFEVYVKKLRGSIGFKVLSVLKCNYSIATLFLEGFVGVIVVVFLNGAVRFGSFEQGFLSCTFCCSFCSYRRL
jgi:hypothetical protein